MVAETRAAKHKVEFRVYHNHNFNGDMLLNMWDVDILKIRAMEHLNLVSTKQNKPDARAENL